MGELGVDWLCLTTFAVRMDMVNRSVVKVMDLVVAQFTGRVGVEELPPKAVGEEARFQDGVGEYVLNDSLEAEAAGLGCCGCCWLAGDGETHLRVGQDVEQVRLTDLLGGSLNLCRGLPQQC